MTTALATKHHDHSSDQSADVITHEGEIFAVHKDEMDAHVRAAIARMVNWCQKQPQGAEFLARGFVVDTLGDITQQVADYFPASIDVSPVIDDMSFVVTQQAKNSGQRFQELELAYIGDGKIPEAAQANMQAFVKWYSAENVIGDDAQGQHNRLKPGWGGGAGGDGASMLKLLNLATKKGFLLQVRSLDINDAKSRTLLANLDVVQAFGGSPEALKEAIEIIAKGGPEAATMKAVVTQMVEIKTLRAALTNAGDTPAAGPIAAALAIKTEALSVQLATLKTPAVIKAAIGHAIDVVQIDVQARQIESVISTLSSTVRMPTIASRVGIANDVAPRTMMTAQIAQAVQAIQITAKTQGMPIRDMIAVTLAKTATPEILTPVMALTQVMAKPEFLPTIEKSIAPVPALAIREALTTPVLQAVAQAPVKMDVVTQNLHAVAAQTDLPTLKLAAAAIENTAPAMRAPVLQSVVENLQAVQMTRSVPESAKPALIVAAAQVEAVAIQARQPEPNIQHHAVPQPLQPHAPLEAITVVTGVKTPEIIPAAAERVIEAKAPVAEQRPETNNDRVIRTMMDGAKAPEAKAPATRETSRVVPVSTNPIVEAKKPVPTNDKKKEPIGGDCGPCKGERGCCRVFSAAINNAVHAEIASIDWDAPVKKTAPGLKPS